MNYSSPAVKRLVLQSMRRHRKHCHDHRKVVVKPSLNKNKGYTYDSKGAMKFEIDGELTRIRFLVEDDANLKRIREMQAELGEAKEVRDEADVW